MFAEANEPSQFVSIIIPHTDTHPPPHTLTPTLLLNYKLLQTNLSCPFVSLQIRNGENFYMYRRTFKAYPNYIDAL